MGCSSSSPAPTGPEKRILVRQHSAKVFPEAHDGDANHEETGPNMANTTGKKKLPISPLAGGGSNGKSTAGRGSGADSNNNRDNNTSRSNLDLSIKRGQGFADSRKAGPRDSSGAGGGGGVGGGGGGAGEGIGSSSISPSRAAESHPHADPGWSADGLAPIITDNDHECVNQFRLQEVLGCGAYGYVRESVNERDGCTYALKCVSKKAVLRRQGFRAGAPGGRTAGVLRVNVQERVVEDILGEMGEIRSGGGGGGGGARDGGRSNAIMDRTSPLSPDSSPRQSYQQQQQQQQQQFNHQQYNHHQQQLSPASPTSPASPSSPPQRVSLLPSPTDGRLRTRTAGAVSTTYSTTSISTTAAAAAIHLSEFKEEIATLRSIQHPHIVRLFDVLGDDHHDLFYLVFEFCPIGPVMTLGPDTKPFTEDRARLLFRQLAQAVDYLHTRGIAHRDIKPANILLHSKNIIKLADFGLTYLLSNSDTRLRRSVGTPAFQSPEAISGDGGSAADVWAMGVTLHCFVFGRTPWPEVPNVLLLYKHIREDSLHIEPGMRINPALVDVLRRLLEKNAAQRITASLLLEEDWVARVPMKVRNGEREVTPSKVSSSRHV